jgi:hypothetical protein
VVDGLAREIFLYLLYLTPFGYFLNSLNLLSGELTKGVVVQLPIKEGTISADIKSNPSSKERRHWFINGSSLFFQANVIILNSLGGKYGQVYAWFSLTFGTVCLVSAIKPDFNWNKEIIKKTGVTPIIAIFIFYLLFTVAFKDILNFILA